MEIKAQLSQDKTLLTLTLMGKFDYTCHQLFQSSYETITPPPQRIVLDVLEVPSIDSSALGMLLLLRTYAGGDESDVSIVNTQPDICKLLKTCRFDDLFKVQAL
ncbi:MAG: anti-anti-sigma factor [Pseudohongiellaceae bacterium]|jgi:anti-anti-sigma factor